MTRFFQARHIHHTTTLRHQKSNLRSTLLSAHLKPSNHETTLLHFIRDVGFDEHFTCLSSFAEANDLF